METLPPYASKAPQFKAHRPVEGDFVQDTTITHSTIEISTRMEWSPTVEEPSCCPLSYQKTQFYNHEDEDYIPWQEEMRRVEAARFRRHLSELKRARHYEHKKYGKAKEWVWVVDEEMEVQEVETKVSLGERLKGVWRKIFNGKRRLSADELPLREDRVMLRKLTVNF